MRTIILLAAFTLVSTVQTLRSQEQISLLPNGGHYIANKIIVTNKYGTANYAIGKNISGFATTGIASIDKLCSEIGVIAIEPFYPGRLTKPNLKRELARIYIFTLKDGIDAQNILGRFGDDPNIEFADLYAVPEVCYIPNDPRFAEQWFLSRIQADDCWDIVRGDATRSAVIGIDDTGVYWDHPDLFANIWVNAAEDVNHNGIFDPGDNDNIDADSNGYIDDVIGWDFGNHDNNPREDTPIHGTMIAGCASEVTDNDIGGAGIGFSARLMCVKGSNSQGDLVAVYLGIIYAAENGVNVINCSWGSPNYVGAYQAIINAAYQDGVFIVAAGGGTSNLIYPAAYDHVLAVTASDQYDHLLPGFGFGYWVDVAAPGEAILSTWGQSGYQFTSGSSSSSAITSGLAGLIKAWHPSYNPDQLDTLIRISADSIGNQNPNYPNAIRINAFNWLNFTKIEDAKIPENFSFSQNYPNPFNAQTMIQYSLSEQADVSIDIFDILGRNVVNIAEGLMPAGKHLAVWDASEQASGIYFYRIKAGDKIETKKMVLMK